MFRDAGTLPTVSMSDINGLFAAGKINEACKNKLIAISQKLQANPNPLALPQDELNLLTAVMNGNTTACNDEGFSISSIPIWVWLLVGGAVLYTVID